MRDAGVEGNKAEGRLGWGRWGILRLGLLEGEIVGFLEK